jgi:acylphosphatase
VERGGGSQAAELMTESTAQPPVRARIVVAGRVQGVGYRAFCVRVATQRRLSGGVKNLEDGRVELEVEGSRDLILALLGDLKTGPPAARVTTVAVEWAEATGRFEDFRVWY